jgi:hypothetical protein
MKDGVSQEDRLDLGLLILFFIAVPRRLTNLSLHIR